MKYERKEAQARAYLADPSPDPADYPWIMSEVGVTAPTAQADAYAWAAVLLAHVAIGALMTALLGLAVGAGRAALIVAGAYLVLWEGGQLAFAGAALADCLIDASAVAGGALIAATLWTHARLPLAAAIAALAGLLVAGIRRRGPTDRKDLP